ncbi:MAG: response regulator [Myxococcales bacterium]|nr:response regulator [Myxococcales bacterium]
MTQPATILLVEDDIIDQAVIRRAVEKELPEFQWATADSLHSARAYLASHPVDLAVVDLSLGDGYGGDLLSDSFDTPMIILTGTGDEEHAVSVMRDGAFDYVVKDICLEYLKRLPGTITAAIASHQRRKAEMAQREEMSHFVSTAAHDLRSPLAAVQLCLEIAAEQLREDPAEAEQVLTRGRKTVGKMADFLSRLLAYCGLSEGDLSREPVALNEIVAEVLEELVPFEGRRLSLGVGPLPTVQGDPIRLREVFQNLLENALKFTPERDANISVYSEDLGNEWEISVKDNGPGIDPEIVKDVFRPMVRRNSEHAPAGYGLGLAVCKRVVELHHGTIDLESILGEGTTFRIRLPKNS